MLVSIGSKLDSISRTRERNSLFLEVNCLGLYLLTDAFTHYLDFIILQSFAAWCQKGIILAFMPNLYDKIHKRRSITKIFVMTNVKK